MECSREDVLETVLGKFLEGDCCNPALMRHRRRGLDPQNPRKF